ncbi:MAG TPA: family 16 glycoside hydrolase [Terriglobia bacterium]|nr:family 16 glycoside hydrolase [Terriglobia bacterium]
MGLQAEMTSFTLDNMGRFLCNTLQEAFDSAAVTVAGRPRGFDVIVIGGGTFGAVMASRLFLNDETHSRRILVLESGPFALPEHVQNMPFQGGTPDFRAPWDSHPALGYAGLLYAIGGRSLAWGGWSPQLLDQEFKNWPAAVVTALKDTYFRQSSDQIGVTDSNDFIYGRLHMALRRQLFDGLALPAAAPHALQLASLPDHPAVRYAGLEAVSDLAAAAGASTGGSTTTTTGSAALTDDQLRELLGLPSGDATPRADMLNLLKLEAPLAVQARTEPGLFPFNKFSAVPELIKVARVGAGETGGIDAVADARKRIMIVPKVPVLDIITETQIDNWVRVTGVRVKDTDGLEKVISLASSASGKQSAVVISLGTIESTRLATNTFKDSLAGRAAQRMGKNLIAHLRSNLTIRIPKTSLTSLTASVQTSLQASALFVKGKANIAGQDRFFHLQITASGLNKLGQDSEAELFKKIPDTEQLDAMLRADDSHVVITLRGIGEMTPQNPDSFIRLSPTKTENFRSVAEVTLADVKTGTSNTPESNVDKQTWDAMDALADEVALIFANGHPFEILLTKEGKTVPMPAGSTVANMKTQHPYPDRRDAEGSTHHDAGTLWMGTDAATSVTNEFGRIHDTTNCYVAAPALFPSLGSPNPMLTGVALSRRTADLLEANVLPRAATRIVSAGFTALFDGTVNTFKKWRLAGAPNSGQGFSFVNGELASYGASDFSLLYYAPQAFSDFHLRLQFRVFDQANCNSGVFIRFRDPLARLPVALRQRGVAEGAPVGSNPAWTAVFSGFEVQIDDNARGDVTKDYYARRPEPDGLFKNRTGAIYKIPAGDLIIHTGGRDSQIQHYTPGPATRPGVWMQYDIVVTANHYEVTLTDTETGVSQLTTVFDNPDGERGVAKINGAPAGFIGVQSYPGSPVAFRDIWIK